MGGIGGLTDALSVGGGEVCGAVEEPVGGVIEHAFALRYADGEDDGLDAVRVFASLQPVVVFGVLAWVVVGHALADLDFCVVWCEAEELEEVDKGAAGVGLGWCPVGCGGHVGVAFVWLAVFVQWFIAQVLDGTKDALAGLGYGEVGQPGDAAVFFAQDG